MTHIEFCLFFGKLSFRLGNASFKIAFSRDNPYDRIWRFKDRVYCSFYDEIHGTMLNPRIEVYSFCGNRESETVLQSDDPSYYRKIIENKVSGGNIFATKICSSVNRDEYLPDWELDNESLVSQKEYFSGKTAWIADREIVMKGWYVFNPLKQLRGISSYIDIFRDGEDLPRLLALAIVSSSLFGGGNYPLWYAKPS